MNHDQIRIGYLSTTYHTSFILKGANWLENKLNLKPEWNLFGGGPAIVNELETGQLDLGYIGLPPVMIGIDRGIKIKCVAGGHVEGTVFTGKDGSSSFGELNNDLEAVLKQYSGYKIGCPPSGSIHDVIIRHYLNKFGFESEIDVKNYEWADFIPGAIEDGEIEAAVGTPSLSVLCGRVFDSKLIIPPERLWPWNPSYGIIASTKFIRDSPEIVQEFLALHEEATNLMRLSPDEAAKIVAKVIPVIDQDFIFDSFKISPKYCASLPNQYIDSTLRFVKVLKDLDYIKKDLIDNDIFDPRFINKIHLEKEHYTQVSS
jgi:NitT/TauT family transport system substrate-binding protein